MSISKHHTDFVSTAVYSPSAAAQSWVASSWRRSLLNYELDPSNQKKIERVENNVLAQSLERLGALIHSASYEMDRLFGLVGDSGCGLYLTDRDGIVLDHRCKDGDMRQFGEVGLGPGANCSEAAEGTNGMGTCLAEERTVIIHRDEHFHARNTSFTCIAAPVFGADGEILAALDISTARDDQTKSTNLLMANALLQSTRRIEEVSFRIAYPNTRIIALDLQSFEGAALMAVDADDLVVGATRAVRLAFGLPIKTTLEPKPAADFLEQEYSARDISAVQKSAILRALSRSSGNMSAAARQLGIGRTTLYRRMKALGLQN